MDMIIDLRINDKRFKTAVNGRSVREVQRELDNWLVEHGELNAIGRVLLNPFVGPDWPEKAV